jgi:hypothetical protein
MPEHWIFELHGISQKKFDFIFWISNSIKDGSHASSEYFRLIHPDTLIWEKEKIKVDLLAYCRQDTLAMVRIKDQLMK